MTVRQLHKHLGDLITDGKGKFTVLQMRDPEGNGTPQLANHVEEGHWKPRHDEFTPIDEIEDAIEADQGSPASKLKPNAVLIWPR